jgi:hypothetical protein
MIFTAIINITVNTILTLSSLGLLLHTFKESRKSLWNSWLGYFALRSGLFGVICTTIYNVVATNTPSVAELILNSSMVVVFLCFSSWQYKELQKAQIRKERAVIKKSRALITKNLLPKKAKIRYIKDNN